MARSGTDRTDGVRDAVRDGVEAVAGKKHRGCKSVVAEAVMFYPQRADHPEDSVANLAHVEPTYATNPEQVHGVISPLCRLGES